MARRQQGQAELQIELPCLPAAPACLKQGKEAQSKASASQPTRSLEASDTAAPPQQLHPSAPLHLHSPVRAYASICALGL
jgi:hypothetical protein